MSSPEPDVAEGLARAAYEAYRDEVKGFSPVTDLPLPDWHALNERVKDGWRAAGWAAANYAP